MFTIPPETPCINEVNYLIFVKQAQFPNNWNPPTAPPFPGGLWITALNPLVEILITGGLFKSQHINQVLK